MSAATTHDADPDDDDEFVPALGADSSTSEDEPETKRPRIDATSPTNTQTAADGKEARDALWSSFQASLSEEPMRVGASKELVKIEKRYRYAGEEVVEVVEVPIDSSDAKKWPLWRSPEETQTTTSSEPPPESGTGSSKPAPKRPGPRKSKTSLPSLPTSSQKTKKLSTLDKSAMDWRAHVQGSESGLKDELEANRRSGGYIEKVEFLNRVEERKANVMEAGKSGKRRRP